MKTLLNDNIKIFFRNKFLCGAYLIILLACNAYLIYELTWIPEGSTIYFLFKTQNLGVASFIIFAFLSYEFIMKLENIHLKETIAALSKGKIKIYGSKIIFLIFLSTLFSMNVLVYNIGVYFKHSVLYLPYLVHIIKNIIINIFFPSIIASLLGATIALRFKRFAAYGVMTIAIFCASPFFENVVFTVYYMTSNNPNPINLYPYWDVFKIFAPNLTVLPDTIYGLAIEAPRWFLAVFWILFLCGIFIFQIYKEINKKRNIICSTIVIFAIASFALYLQPSSVVRADYRPDGVSFGEQSYEKTVEETVKKADFDVLSYDMNLDIRRQMKANVSMIMETSKEIDRYEFTLYHGYEIIKITDCNGQEIPFTREGNYFNILKTFENGKNEINIQYAGSGNKYYSNYQGIALPGYFPYYPMAGKLKLWDKNTQSVYVNTEFEPKSFTIKVNSPLNIISNLNQSSHVFKGTSTTVTLIGGFIVEENINGLLATNCPIARCDNTLLMTLNNRWDEIKAVIGEERNITFDNKKIIMMPRTVCSSSGGQEEGFVYLDDHVLIKYNDTNLICRELIESIVPDSEGKQNVEELFAQWVTDKESFMKEYYNEMPTYEQLEPLKNQKKLLEENFAQYIETKKRFGNLFVSKAEQLGEEHMIQTTYQYLLDEDNDMNEVDFLYNLEVAK